MRGMDIKTIRRLNLRRLIAEKGGFKEVAALAETNADHLSVLASERPRKTRAGTIRTMGDKLARKLESGCGKPQFWMDSIHEWTDEQRMWMDRFVELPPDARQEALDYLEYLFKKYVDQQPDESDQSDDE